MPLPFIKGKSHSTHRARCSADSVFGAYVFFFELDVGVGKVVRRDRLPKAGCFFFHDAGGTEPSEGRFFHDR